MKLRSAALLLGLAALPILADAARSRDERCALDGVEVSPSFRARVMQADGSTRSYCGVECAQRWLHQSGIAPRKVLVLESTSGQEIEADSAWFVRCHAAARNGAPDPIRVFASHAEATRFVRAYGGTLLSEGDRPFARNSP